MPIGVGAAIYLEEYSNEGRLKQLIQLNLSNLAGVPSIVYGILGLALFVRVFGLGRSLLSGALTLSLLILPVIILASQEAIRAVMRGSYHKGGRWTCRVYQRRGQHCEQCRTLIRSIRIPPSKRATYYCPRCQDRDPLRYALQSERS